MLLVISLRVGHASRY